jgi:hypothetical protein
VGRRGGLSRSRSWRPRLRLVMRWLGASLWAPGAPPPGPVVLHSAASERPEPGGDPEEPEDLGGKEWAAHKKPRTGQPLVNTSGAGATRSLALLQQRGPRRLPLPPRPPASPNIAYQSTLYSPLPPRPPASPLLIHEIAAQRAGPAGPEKLFDRLVTSTLTGKHEPGRARPASGGYARAGPGLHGHGHRCV